MGIKEDNKITEMVLKGVLKELHEIYESLNSIEMKIIYDREKKKF